MQTAGCGVYRETKASGTMSGKYTIHVPSKIPTAGEELNKLPSAADAPDHKPRVGTTPSTEAEKKAAREKVQWHAKGHGRGAYLEMFCPLCSLQTTIENPSLNAGVFHCGHLERCPEKVYEMYCVLRDNDGRPRVPERPFKVRWV
jgi:hypothetical protein